MSDIYNVVIVSNIVGINDIDNVVIVSNIVGIHVRYR